MSAIKKLYKILDRFEDVIRGKLSHHPIPYAFVGGVAIVLFWRGVWHLADELPIISGSIASIVAGSVIMLSTGLFVSFFIGDRIILSGLKKEKKIAEQTETEIEFENSILGSLDHRVGLIEVQLREIKALLDKKSE